MRWWPRSIRARDTVLATLAAGSLLGVVAIGVDQVIRYQIRTDYGLSAERAGTQISAAYRDNLLGGIFSPDGAIRLIQVVSVQGQIISATPDAVHLPPLSTHRPPADDRVQIWEVCPAPGGGCMMLNGIRVTADADSPVVYSGYLLPALLNEHILELLIALVWLILVAYITFFAWWRVGHTLRPIMIIRSQLAEFSITDLSRRVPEPPGEDEIAQLARTANSTLDRLELAVERQRRFSSDASHELRTPIAGLRAQLEAALLYPDDTDLLETIKSALKDTDRLEAIVGDLLLLARLGTDHKVAAAPVDLGELVAAELEERSDRALIGSDLQSGVVVEGVRMQILRVLVNLLDNAERYGEGVIDVVVYAKGDFGVLMVTDRGAGIPPEDRERVFERFTRLDSARSRGAGGTGLGLAIARDIAKAHSGTLHIEDSPTGARFVLRLPLSPTQQPPT